MLCRRPLSTAKNSDATPSVEARALDAITVARFTTTGGNTGANARWHVGHGLEEGKLANDILIRSKPVEADASLTRALHIRPVGGPIYYLKGH